MLLEDGYAQQSQTACFCSSMAAADIGERLLRHRYPGPPAVFAEYGLI